MWFDESDVDQCRESWRDLFLNAVESIIPLKIKLKDARSPRWIDGEIIKLSRKKRLLFKKAKHSNSAVHWDNYRSIRKEIKTVTKRKYREFLKDLQADLKDNQKSSGSSIDQKQSLQGFQKLSTLVVLKPRRLRPRETYSITFLHWCVFGT